MRRRGRVDANQSAIVRDLRKIGASVFILSSLGDGAPDIAVGFRGRNYFFELKDPTQPPSARRLTDWEQVFHAAWRGQVSIAESIHDIWDVIK